MVFKKFFCCFELETGGLFIGWAGIILNILDLLNYTLQFSLQTSSLKYYSDYLRTTLRIDESRIFGIWILILAISYGTIFLLLWGNISLLNGTKRREHKKVLIFIIIQAILTIIEPLKWIIVAGFNEVVLVMIAVFGGLSIYVLLCIYSLYKMLEMESNQGTRYKLTTVKTVPNQQMVQDHHALGSDYPPSYQEVTKLAEANQ